MSHKLSNFIGSVAIPLEKRWEGHWGIVIAERRRKTHPDLNHYVKVVGGSICKEGEGKVFLIMNVEIRCARAIEEKVEVHRVLQEHNIILSSLPENSITNLLYLHADVASHHRKTLNKLAKGLGELMADKVTLAGQNKTLKEQITRINEKCDDLEEENTRLYNIIDLGKKGSLNPDADNRPTINIMPDMTDDEKRRLRIQGKAKAGVRDRKAQEKHERNPK